MNSDGTRLTQEELERHLDEQLDFLRRSAEAFDEGHDGEAKRLATTLRVLLHDTHQSHSLLGQLNKKDRIAFLDTAFAYDPNNLMPTHGLIGVHLDTQGARYFPFLDRDNAKSRELSFEDWWNQIVFADPRGLQISRKTLILTAANRDGGAHVDPELPAPYAALSRHGGFGWRWGEQPLKSPERAAIRQIAHEVLKTLDPTYEQKPSLGSERDPSSTKVDDERCSPASGERGKGRQPEVSGGKMRFFPEAGEIFFQGRLIKPTIAGANYRFQAKVDTITQGSVRCVVGGAVSDPITKPGAHTFEIRAGDEQRSGIFGSFTDAVLDSVSLDEMT